MKEEETKIINDTEASSTETPRESAEEIKDKEQEYLLGWRRCLADFENYKKRQQENQKNIDSYIKEDLILQIIPVIDNFRSAMGHIPDKQKGSAWVVGIMHIQKQLENILKENDAIEIEVKTGDEFNPNFHEAIANNEKQDSTNKIKQVILQGYRIGEKIIRPARVIVE